MTTTKTLLTMVAVIVGVAGLLIGSPAIALPVIAVVAIVGLQANRHDQPISAEVSSWSARWYFWVAAGAASVGLDRSSIKQDLVTTLTDLRTSPES